MIKPMLARAVTEPFDSPIHLFEPKWDGIRCLAFVERGRVRLQTRDMVEITNQFPELSSLTNLPAGTIVDGELVILQDGKPSLDRMLQRVHLQDPTRIGWQSQNRPAVLIGFDLLFENSRSIMSEPLRSRREALEELISKADLPALVWSQGMHGHGVDLFAVIKELRLEGMMAKSLDSPYLPGKRSRTWLRIKPAYER
jgi:ATP-dependent DNA ligase